MLLNLFQFDIFGFISGFVIIVFVIAIIFFIIVILVVYKLLHSNVDNIEKKRVKVTNIHVENISNKSKNISMDKLSTKEILSDCKYCGEKVEENATFCPYCGSNLSV